MHRWGHTPAADPQQVLTDSISKWKDRDAVLLALVKKQAGVGKLLLETRFSLAELERVREFTPSPDQLKELEKRFYAENAEYRV